MLTARAIRCALQLIPAILSVQAFKQKASLALTPDSKWDGIALTSSKPTDTQHA